MKVPEWKQRASERTMVGIEFDRANAPATAFDAAGVQVSQERPGVDPAARHDSRSRRDHLPRTRCVPLPTRAILERRQAEFLPKPSFAEPQPDDSESQGRINEGGGAQVL